MRIIGFVFLTFLLFSCTEESTNHPYLSEYALMEMELAYYEDNTEELIKLADAFNDQCEKYYHLISDKSYDDAPIHQYLNAIIDMDYDKKEKELMPMIKAEYIEEFYFPTGKSAFLPALWNSTDAMWEVMGTATDPMLDLYEWSEFEIQVSELKKKIDILMAYDVDLELLKYNNKKYIDHPSKFNPWIQSIDDFFQVVSNKDNNLDEIKAAANKMKVAYFQYINWFIKEDKTGHISFVRKTNNLNGYNNHS